MCALIEICKENTVKLKVFKQLCYLQTMWPRIWLATSEMQSLIGVVTLDPYRHLAYACTSKPWVSLCASGKEARLGL